LFESATPYRNQKYSHLKKECVSAGRLFEDPEFPTVASSLSYTGYAPRDIVWRRPGASELGYNLYETYVKKIIILSIAC
jgi:hypothetical protein